MFYKGATFAILDIRVFPILVLNFGEFIQHALVKCSIDSGVYCLLRVVYAHIDIISNSSNLVDPKPK